MDICFLFPPTLGNRGYFRPHLGVAYLQAALADKGIKSCQYIDSVQGNTEQICRKVLESHPPIVGFTVFDQNLGLALNLAQGIKAQSPSTWVLFGGPTSTFSHNRILDRYSAVDLCTIGEMEEAGPLIIQELLGSQAGSIPDRLHSIPGAAFRIDNSIYSTGFPPLVPEQASGPFPLDQISSPYLSGVLTDGNAGVLTGRGCNQNCIYCSFATIGRKKIRLHSLERVLAELDVISYNTRQSGGHQVVTFHDDTFTLFPERAKQLCRELIDRHPGLTFTCITRADKVDEELLGLMKAAGFEAIAFGLESAVPSVLRKIGKVRPPNSQDTTLEPEREFLDKVERAVITAKKLGMMVGVSIILGLPGEEKSHAKQTLAFVRKLPIDYYMHNVLNIFEGTPLWENLEQYGYEVMDGPLGLPIIAKYNYDPFSVRPEEKCSALRDAEYELSIAVNGLFGCSAIGSEHLPLSLIVLHSDTLSQRVSDWLAQAASMNGVLLQVYDDPESFDLNHIDDTLLFMASKLPCRYYLQLVKYSEDAQGQITWRLSSGFSEVARARSDEMVTLITNKNGKPLYDWSLNGQSTCDICDPADRLTDRFFIDHFAKDFLPEHMAEIMAARAKPPSIKNVGRFLTSAPPCAALSRIEVDQHDNIRVCQNGPVIGKVGDSVTDLRYQVDNILACPSAETGAQLSCPIREFSAETLEAIQPMIHWFQVLAHLPFYVEDMADLSQ